MQQEQKQGLTALTLWSQFLAGLKAQILPTLSSIVSGIAQAKYLHVA